MAAFAVTCCIQNLLCDTVGVHQRIGAMFHDIKLALQLLIMTHAGPSHVPSW